LSAKFAKFADFVAFWDKCGNAATEIAVFMRKREREMSKYEQLWQHLKNDGRSPLRLTFNEIEAVLGFPIDHSFLTYKKEAVQFGYQVGKISKKEKTVLFEKTSIQSGSN
jgi:hypothetical protein